MNKLNYQAPFAEVSKMMSDSIICVSGAGNESFGNGSGFNWADFD